MRVGPSSGSGAPVNRRCQWGARRRTPQPHIYPLPQRRGVPWERRYERRCIGERQRGELAKRSEPALWNELGSPGGHLARTQRLVHPRRRTGTSPRQLPVPPRPRWALHRPRLLPHGCADCLLRSPRGLPARLRRRRPRHPPQHPLSPLPLQGGRLKGSCLVVGPPRKGEVLVHATSIRQALEVEGRAQPMGG